MKATEIQREVLADCHGRREYEERYLAFDGDTVVGSANTLDALAAEVHRVCREAGVNPPDSITVWDQEEN